MYELKDRVLFKRGITVLDDINVFNKYLIVYKGKIKNLNSIKVLHYPDIDKYDMYFDTKHSITEDEIDKLIEKDKPLYKPLYPNWLTEEYLVSIPQDKGISNKQHQDRIHKEYAFFQDTDMVGYIERLSEVISNLKEKTIVGIGRGSSVSSYILYLLGCHYVNPIIYDIKFSDFCKDMSYD